VGCNFVQFALGKRKKKRQGSSKTGRRVWQQHCCLGYACPFVISSIAVFED